MSSSSRPVAATLRLYRAMANAFPYEFKNAYREEMLQVTEDVVEPIWQRHGAFGLLRLLGDVTVRVVVEHLASVWRDVRYGARVLAKSPGFTAAALISLTLGISIATCADSEMNGMILRKLPAVANPDELVGAQAPISYPNYQRFRELRNSFSSTLAYIAPTPFGVSFGGRTERAWGHLVTPDYFSTLGVRPTLGRVFDRQDEKLGEQPVVVISYRFWQGVMGGDTDVVGKTLRVNGHSSTIVGVGPKDFLGASPALFVADLWMPLSSGEVVAPELAGNALGRRDLTM